MSYTEQENKRRLLPVQDRNTLIILIAAQFILFCILAFIRAIYFLNHNETAMIRFQDEILEWVALPAEPSLLLVRPWTLFTHMFIHQHLGQLIGNMLWLWFFGYILHDLTGNRKLMPVFIYGALTGALIYILSYNLAPALQRELAYHPHYLGASAGIMAIAVATTVIAPGYRLLPMLNGGIPIWILTVIYVVIDLALIPGGHAAEHLAHLGGALMGLLFIYFLRKGYDWSEWMNRFFDWVNNLFNPDKPVKGKSVREELYYKPTGKPFTKTANLSQRRIDEILDKISQKGYNQLTEEEKDLLRRAGEEEL